MRRSRILALLLAGACHGTSATEPTVPPAPSPLAGRAAGDLSCPGNTSVHRHEASCDGVKLDPPSGHGGFTLDPPYVPDTYGDEGIARRARSQRALKCRQDRIKVCGVDLVGPAGSYALTCRDAQGAITGVRLVAPDGSVVAEGACDRFRADGAWIWWREGRIQMMIGYRNGDKVGLHLSGRGSGYETGFWPSQRPANGPQ